MVQLIYTFSDGVYKNSLCSCVCWGIWFENSNVREAKISCKTCPVEQEIKIQDHFPISTAVAQNGRQSFEFCLRQEKGWLTCEPSLHDHNPNLIYSICPYSRFLSSVDLQVLCLVTKGKRLTEADATVLDSIELRISTLAGEMSSLMEGVYLNGIFFSRVIQRKL